MKKRKHRLVVEITLTHPVTEKRARQALSLLIDRDTLTDRQIWFCHPPTFVQKLDVKEFSRVHRAQVRRERQEAAERTFELGFGKHLKI